MIKAETDDVARLMRRIVILLKDDIIPFLTTAGSFNVSDFPKAIDAVYKIIPEAGVTIAYRPDSRVPVHVTPKGLTFSATASYFLVGCLGGLGRSLVAWMVVRGARHFVFLSRSGADKPEAARLIGELQKMASETKNEMTVTVVKGSVANREDVDRAISIAKTPIRGVMQQAMFLKNDLFEDMSLESWQAVLSPKVQGSLNLHEALIHEPLDFFVMTSSILGAIGAST
ncbi:KR-domain-containing protein [Myriangium duriaei CBS 260.36]|uniref:KR-domain-containing protein n=1 Tax=Myriangium duriaei CBS 260.36 TaxID=1168546 RepID=A0A9P4J7J5_9PEZI|nr:KR-domain-containing protein [Myriangium duriaei CBS 260.36]